MEFSGEARTFLSIMLTGMILGCAFDVFRTARNTFKLRTLGTAATDILYWLLAVAIVFAVLIAVNRGQIRFYVFIALALGAAAYFRFFSRHVLIFLFRLVRLVNKIKTSIEQALRTFFLTIVVKPIRFISHIVSRPLLGAGRAAKRLYKRLLPPLPPQDKPPD